MKGVEHRKSYFRGVHILETWYNNHQIQECWFYYKPSKEQVKKFELAGIEKINSSKEGLQEYGKGKII